jgi:hypothetical protein
MADVFVIVRYDISQGDASGDEIAVFTDLDEARRAFDAGRASGAYVDEGSFWSGATAYEGGATLGARVLRARRKHGRAERPPRTARDQVRRAGWHMVCRSRPARGLAGLTAAPSVADQGAREHRRVGAIIADMSDDSWSSFENEALADERTWSATFDSHDQYRDLVYFVVTLQSVSAPFMVQIALDWAATITDWDSPEFVAGLRAQIARVAATGNTNTTHAR